MAPARDEIQARLRSIKNVLTALYVAHLAEAKLGTFLHERLPNFICAAEGAACDAALLIRPLNGPRLAQGFTERLFTAIKDYGDEKLLLSIDFKTVSPSTQSKDRGGVYDYKFVSSSGQSDCAAYLVLNPALPHLVALLPRQILTTRQDRNPIHVCSHELMLLNGLIEPFPPEWQACLTPVELLPLALNILVAYTEGRIPQWYNPYTDIVYEGCQSSSLQPVRLLRPVEESSLKDYDYIYDLWDAFRKFTSDYEVLRPTISPSVGDFLILHKPSQTVIAVELKRSCVKRGVDGTLKHAWGRNLRLGTGQAQKVRYFSGISRWDYLCTAFVKDTRWCFYFMRRDEMPLAWFTMKTRDIDRRCWLSWTPQDPTYLDTHMVEWAADEASVSSFTALLESYRTSSGLQITVEPRLGGLTSEDIDSPEVENEPSLDVETRSGKDQIQRPLRGTERRWAPKLWEGDHVHLIGRGHQHGDNGRLYQLGSHPIGSWAYAIDGNSDTTFSELPPPVNIIFVNFGHINLGDTLLPDDARHQRQFLRVTSAENGHPSLYILIPERGSLAKLPETNYFLLSSEALATKERSNINKELECAVAGQQWPAYDVDTTSGEMIDTNAVSVASVLPALRSFMEAGDGSAMIAPNRVIKITDKEGFQRLLSTKREAARQSYRKKMGLIKLGMGSQGRDVRQTDPESSMDVD